MTTRLTNRSREVDMPQQDSTTSVRSPHSISVDATPATTLALIVVWSRSEPERIGEVILIGEGDEWTLGRSYSTWALTLVQQRPGENRPTGPLRSSAISRVQWRLLSDGRALSIENVGKRALLHDGVAVTRTRAAPGARLEMADELMLMVASRPVRIPAHPLPPQLAPRFGCADEFGIVGEAPAAWELRRQLAFAAGRDDHVLISGPSGTGKELAARAIHGLSRRAGGRLIARNAATFPESLIDAELFGNARDYPNPGTPERPGLIGAADGSSLFLDEIGELSHLLQAHLLRVLDDGEYHRLGEARARRVDIRVVAATNRNVVELKHDLLARLRLRIVIPGLDQRREDVPLIARNLLRRMARADQLLAERCFLEGNPDGEPRWTARLVASLLATPFTTHVRELETWLWTAIMHGGEGGLDSVPEMSASSRDEPSGEEDLVASVDPRSLTADAVRSALEVCEGSRERAWRLLGLRSRHQLVRLIRKFGLGGPEEAALP